MNKKNFNGRLLNKLFDKLLNPILLCVVLLEVPVSTANSQTWIEDTFEDFIDGKLDASGNNIYVSKDGKIRTIHHFDYNNDGYIDLLFPQTHDSYSDVSPTLGVVLQGRNIKESNIPVKGALQATNCDLNHDGFQDLIFCPNFNGIQNPRNFVSIIYGGDDGWLSSRCTSALLVNDIKAVTIADLNNDGWADIVTLNSTAWKYGQPSGNIIRIFWGGERGFLNTRYLDIGIYGAIGITSGDFDNDDFADLAILKEDNHIIIYWATPAKENNIVFDTTNIQLQESKGYSIASGDCDNNNSVDLLVGTRDGILYFIPNQMSRYWREPQKITSFSSSNIVVDDIDKDGLNDLLLSFLSVGYAAGGELMGAKEGSGNAAYILWGSKNGFSQINSTELAAPNLSAAATGDFDGDGQKDIVIAINKGSEEYKTQSIIYYGKGSRQFEKGKVGITTSGASHVIAISESNSKKDKVIFCNSTGGTMNEKVPAFLYWGGAEGFSEKRRADIPFRSGYECSAADFNADGYTDITIMNEMHGGQGIDEDPLAGANIFWGRPGGFDFSIGDRTVLTEAYLGSSNTADLNKDGYLDLVLGQYFVGDFKSNIIIYYGNKDGFSRDKRVLIPCTGRSLSIQLADYDKDGWLDIAANSYNEVGIRIFYGSEKGYYYNRRVELDAPAVCDNETADLNGDGWLDIIVCCYNDIANNNHHDMGLFIFWGSPKGFSHANAQWLPGHTILGPVVADFDSDGSLDIFCPAYHGELTRESEPCFLYWGSKEGFSIKNKSVLTNDSGSHGFAADFNKDGKLDLVVSNHTTDGNHNAHSKVYYNDGNRFINAKIEEIPTKGPHWSHNEDMGHIYNRYWRQTYESPVSHLSKNRTAGNLSFIADVPTGTQLIFEVRSSVAEKELIGKNWTRVNDSGNFSLNSSDKYFQYRAVFVSDNGDRFSVLDKVIVDIKK